MTVEIDGDGSDEVEINTYSNNEKPKWVRPEVTIHDILNSYHPHTYDQEGIPLYEVRDVVKITNNYGERQIEMFKDKIKDVIAFLRKHDIKGSTISYDDIVYMIDNL